jgi:hypothetical protein
LTHAGLGAVAVGGDQGAVAQNALEFVCEVVNVCVRDASLADGLYVLRGV